MTHSAKMTDAEVIGHLRQDSDFNELRKLFMSGYASIEQAMSQRTVPSAIEVRRMEFEAVEKILRKAGVGESRIEEFLSVPTAAPGAEGP